MPARLLARLPKIRRVLLSGGLLIITLATVSVSATAFAQATSGVARAGATRVQRPISEDPLTDQNLVAALPDPAPARAVAATTVQSAAPKDDTDQHIAAIGPAMRPLVTQFNAVWPTAGEITTYFGEVGRMSPRGHAGLDIAAPKGKPIVAADDGEVLKAYWNDDGYGGLIIIGHPSGYESWYGHLERLDVEPGEHVNRGQQIALMGSTGLSTGPHLHFEVRQDGQLYDPLNFLKEANLKPAAG
jgi:murein DD-endopeptidase MepM/ murein hydrolase activator NlpD